jgi:pantoate--beta-alanine ligase
MKVAITASELQPLLAKKSIPKTRILVPTMGSLHEGHLALIHRARKIAGAEGVVILSLFVNPTQFDQADDLRHYPRALEQDLALCKKHGVDIVFAPESGDIYHSDHSVTVTESSLSQRLCGASRTGHFDGVCTVVLKLFNLTQPDIAIFGKKDYQQLAIIRRMVRDLNIPIRIQGVETVREKNGLALSSRNQRLSEQQRSDAQRIRRALLAAQTAHQQGEKSAHSLLNTARKIIESSELDAEIDYLELLDQDNLQPVETLLSPALIATAVFYGPVRLIDNIELA